VGFGFRIAAVAVVVVGGFLFREYLTGNAGDLRVGDCFQEPAGAELIDDVQHTPCTDPHDNEVFYVGDVPGGSTVPSDSVFEAHFIATCGPAFEAYTGLDPETSPNLTLTFYYPTSEGWSDGDHEMICYAYNDDGTKLTASVKR
jgi:hypothetical protein